MSSPIYFPQRNIGKTSKQILAILHEFECNPSIKMDIWLPTRTGAERMVAIADCLGIELELTIPKLHETAHLWVSKVHSVKRRIACD